MVDHDDLIRELRRHYLFSALPDDVLDKIVASGRQAWYDDGTVLFRKGDPGDFFFCVLEGRVLIRVETAPSKILVMNDLGSGAVFGEVALLDGLPRTADAVTEGPACLFTLHRADFRQVLLSECRLEEQLIRLLCERVRWISEQVESRNRAETELRKLHQAVEHSPSIVVITDVAGIIEYVNPKFSAVTGWSREEVVGQTPRLLKSGLTPPETYRVLWRTILDGGEWRGDLCNRKKDESLYWERCSISPIFSESGAISHFVAVMEDITEHKRLQDELSRLATTDSLTGTANRRHFIACAVDEMARLSRSGQPLSVIMLDVDHFKHINDDFGHAAGDATLVALAEAAGTLLREIDVLGRLGGEEFAVILPDTDLAAAAVVAERLRHGLGALATPVGAAVVTVTVSVGVSQVKPEETAIDAALKRADDALYRAKQHGRDRVELETG
ncbi:MAG: diguanylate cyclase [Magnetospirillum sp.]|nr:diguanylate cyclase [Magnetospirillum sp.]